MHIVSRTGIEAQEVAPDAPASKKPASNESPGPHRLVPGGAPPGAALHAEPPAPHRLRRRTKRAKIFPADPVAEAGRKMLRLHFAEMLAKEAGTLGGEDPEALHDMRVATRRQRAVLRMVAPHFRRSAVRPVREGLRTLAGLLGAVRDLDVLLASARANRSSLPAWEARAPALLIDSWTRRRDAARVRLRAHLEGEPYAEFREEYAHFVDTPGAGARVRTPGEPPRPTLVAHVVPAEIAAHYAAVCAFGTVLPWASVETLHALRIESKALRYVLEFFREVLDPCVEEAIEAVVALQDHLGELQDAAVAVGLARDFLAGPEAAANPDAATAAGRYLESHQARIAKLRRSVDRPWRGVSSAAFKASLSRASAAL
jgi:CHAD domain-containing protein